MKRLVAILAIFLTGIFTAGGQADATTLYTTFGTGQTYDQSDGYFVDGSGGYDGKTQIIGAPFTPAINATLDSIDFAAYYVGGSSNQITVQLVNDSAGLPTGSLIASFNFIDILTTTPAVYTATSTVHPLLTASTQYWVVLTPTVLSSTTHSLWCTNNQGIIGVAWEQPPNTSWTWETNYKTPAFDVNGTIASTVPEPGILILLGISMASVVGLRRWWKE
jgi:hypothetical protein